MTKIEEVLSEEWREDTAQDALGDIYCGDGVGILVNSGREHDAGPTKGPTADRCETIESVILLGKRALALVLKHEWQGWEDWVGDGGFPCCPECRQLPPSDDRANWTSDEARERERNPGRVGHKPGCEWGAICEEARRLG